MRVPFSLIRRSERLMAELAEAQSHAQEDCFLSYLSM